MKRFDDLVFDNELYGKLLNEIEESKSHSPKDCDCWYGNPEARLVGHEDYNGEITPMYVTVETCHDCGCKRIC